MKRDTIITIVAVVESVVLFTILMLSISIFNAVKSDPRDVNRDGEANLVDLSVLAEQLRQK